MPVHPLTGNRFNSSDARDGRGLGDFGLTILEELETSYKVEIMPISKTQHTLVETQFEVESSNSGIALGYLIGDRVESGIVEPLRTARDSWIGCKGSLMLHLEEPPKNPRLFQVSDQSASTVGEMDSWVEGQWVWELRWRRDLFVWELNILESLHEILNHSTISTADDSWFWKHDPIGQYSVKSAFLAVSRATTDDVIFSVEEERLLLKVWKTLALSKVTVFSWQLLQDKLPTRQNILQRDIIGDASASTCVLCGLRSLSDAEKMLESGLAIRGCALTWLFMWYSSHPKPNWDSFTTALLWHFKAEWRPILPIEGEEEPTENGEISEQLEKEENQKKDEEEMQREKTNNLSTIPPKFTVSDLPPPKSPEPTPPESKSPKRSFFIRPPKLPVLKTPLEEVSALPPTQCPPSKPPDKVIPLFSSPPSKLLPPPKPPDACLLTIYSPLRHVSVPLPPAPPRPPPKPKYRSSANLQLLLAAVVGFYYEKMPDCNPKCVIKVFTLGVNTWRDIQCLPVVPLYWFSRLRNNGVHLNGTINWFAVRDYFCLNYGFCLKESGVTVEQFVIVSLDFSTETYTQLLLPRGFAKVPDNLPKIVVLMDCLYFCHDFDKTHFVIWQMKDFGVQESWTQLLKISYENFVKTVNLLPLNLSENGDRLILANYDDGDDEDEAFIYNCKNNKVEKIRITNKIIWELAKDYVESLVSTH
ncbi:hypothetical protein TSUD_395560 [Trifolium subterraneum]|uniref:F-box associated domain-containing protein n=1 Tax=Trifolium subterraneum TaxID=3900 RepID=A0A2Z6MYM8_TRISU|nr:hypothetical protein TSUD_395560 [Trifolium subterraneum]